jgi:hypothetical protein
LEVKFGFVQMIAPKVVNICETSASATPYIEISPVELGRLVRKAKQGITVPELESVSAQVWSERFARVLGWSLIGEENEFLLVYCIAVGSPSLRRLRRTKTT